MPHVTIEVLDQDELIRRAEELRRELADVEDCLRPFSLKPPPPRVELSATEQESMTRILEALETERLATSGTATAVLWDDLADALTEDEADDRAAA